MKKRTSQKERYEALYAACEPFRRAKTETIHTLAGIGRRHSLLRYPIMAVLVVYIFIYNLILYGCIQLKMRERLARGMALFMTVVLVFTSVDATVFAAIEKAGAGGQGKSVITAFSRLDESVAVQVLPVGTKESEITFPDTLTVTLKTESEDKPEESTTATEESTTVPEESTTATEESTTAPGSTKPEENPAATEGTGTEENVPVGNSEQSSEKSVSATGKINLTSLLPQPMVVHAAELDERTSAKPKVLIDVTWKLDADKSTSGTFDSSEAGKHYVYMPVIPEGYTVAEGVKLPQITITIQEMEEPATGQTSASQICGWHFDEENVAPKGDLFYDAGSYSIVVAGGSSEVQIPFEDITSVFPESVTVQYADLDGTDGMTETDTKMEEVLDVLGWSCPEYVEDEEGSLPYSGSFFFKAVLGEDGKEKECAFAKGVEHVGVWVVFDAPMLLANATPGTITSDQTWGAQNLAAGTYTIKEGVIVTVSGTITVDGEVIINGGGKILRSSSSGYFNVSGGNLTLKGIEVDGNGNSYKASNSMITVTNKGTLTLDGCRIHDCVKKEERGYGYGAAVNLSGSSAVFKNAVIENCRARNYGGAVYIDGSSLEIHGGTYQGNRNTLSTASYGGGFLYNSSSTVKIYDGRFINNTSPGKGGCIYNTGKENTKTYLYGGYFQGNKSTKSKYEGSGAVFYSSESTADTTIELSGSVQFCGDGTEDSGTDGVYLDLATGASRKALISSELQYPLALYLTAEEGRVIAEGVKGYQLQIKDMKKISVNDVETSGSAWYAKLGNNQIVLTATNPEYDKNFYVGYVANGAEGTVQDTTAYKNGDMVTVKSGEGLTYAGYSFDGWNTKPDGTGTAYQAGSTFPITEDVTLYARWEEAAKYEITYSGLDGAVLSTKPAQHTYGKETTVGNPTKTGYTFAGWKINDGTTAVKDLTLSATGYTADITLTATWTADSYTVTYNYQGATGGNSSASKTVTYGGTYGELPSPTRTGYQFAGWYTAASGGSQVTSSTKVTTTGDHALYARWTTLTYNITYNLNGGALSTGVTNPGTYIVESNDITLKNPTKAGYTFKGWSGANLSGDSNTSVTIAKGSTGDRSYTANWTANTYTVSYNGNGSTGGSMTSSTHTYDAAKNLTSNGFKRSYTVTFNHNYTGSENIDKTANYTFAGWNTKSDGKGTDYADNASVKNLTDSGTFPLYAKWTATSVKYVPTRTGYTFAGWYTTENCTGSRVDRDESYTPISNTTLYAKWTIDSHKVTYNYSTNGGTSATTETADVNYDSSIALTPTATKDGWTFVGWNTNKDAKEGLTSLTMGTKDVTLYAIYSKTLTGTFYSGNAGQSETVPVTIYNKAESGTIILPALKSWTGDSRGFTPVGWLTDGSEDSLNAGGSYTLSENKSFCGKYKLDVTLSFDANGGEGSENAVSRIRYAVMEQDTITYSDAGEVTLPTGNHMSRAGYDFAGWTAGSTEGTVLKGGASVALPTQSTVYYASWEDTKRPELTAGIQSGVQANDDWYNVETLNIALNYSDNEGVTKLYVKVDNGGFTEISGISTAKGESFTKNYVCTEGEHTYTFKAQDAEGNFTETEAVTVKWDKTKPEIGEVTCEQKAANILEWIIGKKSLIVSIPVTDSLSGVKTLTYTKTTFTKNGKETAKETVSVSGKEQEKITLDADWKGTITDIICTDTAGNRSDTKSIKGAGNGIIVENNGPVVKFTSPASNEMAGITGTLLLR